MSLPDVKKALSKQHLPRNNNKIIKLYYYERKLQFTWLGPLKEKLTQMFFSGKPFNGFLNVKHVANILTNMHIRGSASENHIIKFVDAKEIGLFLDNK